MAKLKDLRGEKFNRLSPIEYLGNRKWRCKCDCGKIIDVFTNNLTRGNTKSCGCLNSELASKRSTTHGKTNTRLYHIYNSMKQRCYEINNPSYIHYGQRGIIICKEWLSDFINFYNWSINNGYQKGLSIDRIDVNGNYEPSNCRWITKEEQQRNKTNNIQITYNGKTKPLKTWCVELGLPYRTIFARYKYGNWRDPVTLFETPIKIGNNQTLRGCF